MEEINIEDILFTCKTNDKNKKTFDLSQSKNNVYVHFWASWCPPCKRELPELQKIYNKYNNDIDFIFISCDTSKLDIDTYLFNSKINIPIGYDLNSSVASLYNVRSIPASFLINKNTSMAETLIGARSYDDIESEIKKFYNL